MKNKFTPEQYDKYVKEKTPNSTIFPDCIKAFLTGGIICTIGQALMNFYKYIGMQQELASSAVSITLVFFGALLTGLNIYPVIGKFGGAGSLVPITGFANAVVSPALESKTEGRILGTGAKIFTIAGPVILYGTIASVIAGIIYWLIGLA